MLLSVDPQPIGSASIFQVVRMDMFVQDADFVGVFDSIEVWRSRSTEAGPYEELTGPAWLPARLPKTGGDKPASPVTGSSANIVGKTLEFVIDEFEDDPIAITFTGSDPLTFLVIALQITNQSIGRLSSYVDADGKLVVETVQPGTGTTLRAKPSDAAVFLDLPTDGPDALVFGRSARMQLIAGKSSYQFRDESGSKDFFYKTRFFNRSNNTASEFSQVSSSISQFVQVPPTQVVVGYLDLVTQDGKALRNVDVSLRSNFAGNLVDNKLVAGADLLRRTDADGHVEFSLLRGQKYMLAIAGTNIAKEIVAPTDQAVLQFQLVDPAYATQDDYFKARIPDIPTMERRSL